MHGPDELALFAKRLDAVGAPYMVTGVDEALLMPWLERMGLGRMWEEFKAGS